VPRFAEIEITPCFVTGQMEGNQDRADVLLHRNSHAAAGCVATQNR